MRVPLEVGIQELQSLRREGCAPLALLRRLHADIVG